MFPELSDLLRTFGFTVDTDTTVQQPWGTATLSTHDNTGLRFWIVTRGINFDRNRDDFNSWAKSLKSEGLFGIDTMYPFDTNGFVCMDIWPQHKPEIPFVGLYDGLMVYGRVTEAPLEKLNIPVDQLDRLWGLLDLLPGNENGDKNYEYMIRVMKTVNVALKDDVGGTMARDWVLMRILQLLLENRVPLSDAESDVEVAFAVAWSKHGCPDYASARVRKLIELDAIFSKT